MKTNWRGKLPLWWRTREFGWRLFRGGGPILCEACGGGTWVPRLAPVVPGYNFQCRRCWVEKFNGWQGYGPMWRRWLPPRRLKRL